MVLAKSEFALHGTSGGYFVVVSEESDGANKISQTSSSFTLPDSKYPHNS